MELFKKRNDARREEGYRLLERVTSTHTVGGHECSRGLAPVEAGGRFRTILLSPTRQRTSTLLSVLLAQNPMSASANGSTHKARVRLGSKHLACRKSATAIS